MSKPFTPKTLRFAGCIVAVLVVAAAAMIAVGGEGSHGKLARASDQAAVAARAATPAQSPLAKAEQQNRVRAAMGALPLAFEANQGQSDPRVKYMARGNGYTLFLTGDEAVFAVQSSLGSPSTAASGKFGRSKFDAMRGHVAARGEEKSAAIHMKLVGGKSNAEMVAGSELAGRINYYIGNNPAKWQQGVKQYSAVTYRGVYPGVNLAYHGQRPQLEFDFIVSPGASAAPIDLGFKGASGIATDADGNLVLKSAAGNVLLHKPVAYQEKDGQRQAVDVSFRRDGADQVGFAVGAYDHSRELVIDPTLSYGTYLGGNNEDEVFAIAFDSTNGIYVTGETKSTSGFPGGNAPTNYGFYAFVTKLNSSGTLTYTTIFGGAKTSSSVNNDSGLAVAADSSGNAYITGITSSTNLPIVGPAAQPTSGGGGTCTNLKNSSTPCTDAYAAKLNGTGGVAWSTYIGGTNDDDGYAIALDSLGDVWVAGDTFSSSFYPNNHATLVLYSNFNSGVVLNPPADDGFVAELNPTGTAFLYSTYLGGKFSDQINGIAIDAHNNVFVAGETASTNFPTMNPYQSGCGSDGLCNAHSGTVYYDGFVTEITAGGGSLTYSTYIGGSSDDYAFAIALDSSGDAYITGETSNDDTYTTPAVPYPTTSGAFSTTYNSSASNNAFVTEFDPAGSKLVYSTFLGGSTQDLGGGIAVDTFDDAYVTGMTASSNFPTTSNATQTTLKGTTDAFVTQVLAGGANLGFSTYLGGTGSENATGSGAVGTIVLDSSNNMWVGGSTNSTDFPATGNAIEGSFGGGAYDGFIAEISNNTSPTFNVSATTPSSVSPGSSATSTVTLTALFGYSQSVTLGCSVTGSGSPLPACSASSAFSTNPVTPTASGASSTLTITTTGSSAALSRKSNIFYAMWLPIVGLSLVGMSFSGKDSRKKKLLGFLMLGIVMAMLFFLPACGGSSNSGGGGGCSGCTPAGSYTVTITGTDANNLTQSTSVTLTVN
ncbi:MAG TPA: SBBP repeat-containing protein [Terriglobales bacterium]|nr:SBBP repeat-containing protein [Terriglobales bacterium]